MSAVLQMPSAQVVGVAEDFLDATRALAVGGEPTFTLDDGWTLQLAVDGGSTQTIAFAAVDFIDIEAALLSEVLNVVNAGLSGATAIDQAGALGIRSNSYGTGSEVEIIGGTARAALGFDVETVNGTDAIAAGDVVNQIPAPGETEVALGSAVQFDVYRSAGAPATTTLRLWVDGEEVYAGLGLASGYSLSSSLVDSAVRRFVIGFPAMTADTSYLVRVAIAGTGIDESWTFRTFDNVSPVLLAVAPTGKRTLRATFAEAVLADDSAESALLPSNWVLARAVYTDGTIAPAAEVDIVGIEVVDSETVDLNLSEPLTFGAVYSLTAAGVADLRGNLSAAPTNSVTFNAALPDFPEGRRFLIADWIPDINWAEDATRDLAKTVAVFQEVLNVLLAEIDDFALILDPDTAPIEYVNRMLEDLGQPFAFTAELVDADRRRLLAVLIDIYRLKGTAPGIINVIRFFLGIEITIDLYSSYSWDLGVDELGSGAVLGSSNPYDLYSYDIISPTALSDEERARIRTIAEYMQPAHTHLRNVQEPADAVTYDHLELGISQLGYTWLLH